MLKAKIEAAINDQINAELYSSYLYLSMSAYFESIDLKGFANWMKIQAQEELIHVGKFFDFVNERSGRVKLQPIAAPTIEWSSPIDAFKAAYDHECHITGLINKLVDLTREESDHATYNFLQWFVGEQVEEEATADSVVKQLKLVGDQGHGLFMIDRELAQRVFVMPPANAGA
jgi:ferritin